MGNPDRGCMNAAVIVEGFRDLCVMPVAVYEIPVAFHFSIQSIPSICDRDNEETGEIYYSHNKYDPSPNGRFFPGYCVVWSISH